MNDSLVNEYYDKLLQYSKAYKTRSFVRREKNDIKNELAFIISNNDNYLLTDSILAYIARNQYIMSSLKSLAGEEYERIRFFMYYYDTKLREYRENVDARVKQYKLSYNLMTDDEKKLLADTDAAIVDYLIGRNQKILLRRRLLVNRIVCSIYGCCRVNNKLDDFIKVCNKVMENPEFIIDNLCLNGFSNTDGLILNDSDLKILMYRVINQVNSIIDENRVIK